VFFICWTDRGQKEFSVKFAAVGPISVYFPAGVETNEDLQAANPKWDMALIASKTGINQRYIAGPDECSSDLGVAAAEKLFRDYDIDRGSIDFLLFAPKRPIIRCQPPLVWFKTDWVCQRIAAPWTSIWAAARMPTDCRLRMG
jgi:hypothetical protein